MPTYVCYFFETEKPIGIMPKPTHCAHNCNQPYDEMHQGHWLKFKFGFPQTGKGSPKFFEIGWQTPEIHKINSFFT